MQTRIVIAIVITVGLVLSLGALTTLYSQNTFAQNSNTGSANGGNSGAGGGQTVNRHLFCNGIGMITPICK
jgi:hypothetical protein